MENVNGNNLAFFTSHCGSAPGGPCNEYVGRIGNITITRGNYHLYSLIIEYWTGRRYMFCMEMISTTKSRGKLSPIKKSF